MTLDRILSHHGNVIAADFRRPLDISLTLKAETLYRNDALLLTRTTAFLGDEPVATFHFAANLATGQIVTL